MQNKFDLSIIVPVYNCENYIERCIESIINNDLPNTEVLIINDGSTDKTLEKCKNFVELYSNIRLINQKNKGVSYSRNLGIKKSKGKYVMFVDADDYLTNDFSKIINLLNNNDCDVLKFSYNLISYNNIKSVAFSSKNFDVRDENFWLDFLTDSQKNMVWGQIVKKECFKNIKFEEKLFYCEDFLFNFELYSQCSNISYTNQIGYNYIINDSSITNNFSNSKTFDKINNIIYVFNKLILKTKNKNIENLLEKKFFHEVIPQIMTLCFEKKTVKKQILSQYNVIFSNDIFESLNFNNVKKFKYNYAIKCIKKNKFNQLYIYSKIYQFLKEIQKNFKIYKVGVITWKKKLV